MKFSVTPTDMLKPCRLVLLCLHVMNSMMSGCSIDITPIWAPLRCPEELIVWQTASNIPMKLIGPLERLSKLLMRSPRGLKRLKSYPMPPPFLMVSEAAVAALMTLSMLSSIG